MPNPNLSKAITISITLNLPQDGSSKRLKSAVAKAPKAVPVPTDRNGIPFVRARTEPSS